MDHKNRRRRQTGSSRGRLQGLILGGLLLALGISVGALLPVDAPIGSSQYPGASQSRSSTFGKSRTSSSQDIEKIPPIQDSASSGAGPVIEVQPAILAKIAPGAASRPQPLFAWDPHAKRRFAPPPATQLLVDLPPITFSADAAGILSVGGLTLGTVADMGVSPQMLTALSAANLQHLQLASDAAGLAVEANNLPILGLAWDAASLVYSAQLLADAGSIPPLYAKAAPLLTHVRLDLVADLAQLTGADQAPIPFDPALVRVDAAALAAVAAQDAPILDLPIQYQRDGSPRMLGLGALEWALLTGAPLSLVNLSPAQMASIRAAGIQQLRLSSEPDGIHVAVNGHPLPTLLWSQGEFRHLAALTGALAGVSTQANADTLAVIDQLVRLMQTVNVNLDIFFP